MQESKGEGDREQCNTHTNSLIIKENSRKHRVQTGSCMRVHIIYLYTHARTHKFHVNSCLTCWLAHTHVHIKWKSCRRTSLRQHRQKQKQASRRCRHLFSRGTRSSVASGSAACVINDVFAIDVGRWVECWRNNTTSVCACVHVVHLGLDMSPKCVILTGKCVGNGNWVRYSKQLSFIYIAVAITITKICTI